MQTILNHDVVLVGPIVTGGPGGGGAPDRQWARVSIRDVSLTPSVEDWRGFGVAERSVEPSMTYDVELPSGTVRVTMDPWPSVHTGSGVGGGRPDHVPPRGPRALPGSPEPPRAATSPRAELSASLRYTVSFAVQPDVVQPSIPKPSK